MDLNPSVFGATDTPGQYIAEASDLGWRPGEWPRAFTRQDFVFVRLAPTRNPANGDVIAVTYRAADGTIVTVYND